MVCIVTRSSMCTRCVLCACDKVNVYLCVRSDTTAVPQKSRLKNDVFPHGINAHVYVHVDQKQFKMI
jgi:hypothetical protein